MFMYGYYKICQISSAKSAEMEKQKNKLKGKHTILDDQLYFAINRVLNSTRVASDGQVQLFTEAYILTRFAAVGPRAKGLITFCPKLPSITV